MPTRCPCSGEGGTDVGQRRFPPHPETHSAPLLQPCRQAGLAWLSVWGCAFCPSRGQLRGWSRVPTPLFLMRPFCSRGRALGHGVAGRRVPH